MRRILATAAVLLAVGAFLVLTLGSSGGNSSPTYNIELDNSFGLVTGADFKVAGVTSGSIKSISLCYSEPKAHCQNPLHALITVQANTRGFGQFHADAFCQSRPQSLIGEYFVDCEPGTTGKVLKPGATIPASHTQSTIPADLVQNIMRLPYRERFSVIINELGAAVAARSEDLKTALRRADPALAQADNLLALLANDAHTIQQLNVNADSVITALANSSSSVQRFIVEADRASTISATQAPAIEATWKKLPAFLEQLKPALQKLGAAADAQDPVFQNLNAASANLATFFHQLTPFSRESTVSLGCGEHGAPQCPDNGASLGSAAKVGIPAVKAAQSPVAHLNKFAKPTPELAQNLNIVLNALDAHKRTASAGGPVEPDPRSPNGGKGYSGLEGVLMYVFNITNAIDYFGPWGHMLGVDAFANATCSPYATPETLAKSLQQYQQQGGNLSQYSASNPRSCYAFLGPHQPGVNESDPSWNAKDATPANPSACVPDPGAAPIEDPRYGVTYTGPSTSACKLTPASLPASDKSSSKPAAASAPPTSSGSAPAAPSVPGTGSGGPPNLGNTIGGVLGRIGTTTGSIVNGATGAVKGAAGTVTGAAGAATSGASSSSQPNSGSQAQQLLNYLLAP